VAGLIDRDHRAFDFVRQAGVVIVPLGQVLGLGVHLGDQLAVVAHLDLSQAVGILDQEVGQLADHVPALGRGHGRPVAFIGRPVGRLDRPLHVLPVAPGHQGPGLGGEGIEGFEILARGGLDPRPVDVHAEGLEGLRAGVHDRLPACQRLR
jgi:hypothetical protein